MLAGIVAWPAAMAAAVAALPGDEAVTAVVGRGDEDRHQHAVLGDRCEEGAVEDGGPVVGVGVDEIDGDRLDAVGGWGVGHGTVPFGGYRRSAAAAARRPTQAGVAGSMANRSGLTGVAVTARGWWRCAPSGSGDRDG
jgi:hypothetical protein